MARIYINRIPIFVMKRDYRVSVKYSPSHKISTSFINGMHAEDFKGLTRE